MKTKTMKTASSTSTTSIFVGSKVKWKSMKNGGQFMTGVVRSIDMSNPLRQVRIQPDSGNKQGVSIHIKNCVKI